MGEKNRDKYSLNLEKMFSRWMEDYIIILFSCFCFRLFSPHKIFTKWLNFKWLTFTIENQLLKHFDTK